MEWGGGSWDHSARHGHRDPSIAALILDSPFASLEMVVRELIVAGRSRVVIFLWLHQEINLSYQGTCFLYFYMWLDDLPQFINIYCMSEGIHNLNPLNIASCEKPTRTWKHPRASAHYSCRYESACVENVSTCCLLSIA